MNDKKKPTKDYVEALKADRIKRLPYLEERISEWAEHNSKLHPRVRLLTEGQVRDIIQLLGKHVREETETPADRKAKQEVHQGLSNAFYDICHMASWGLMSTDSPWKTSIWKEDFPIFEMSWFIEAIVGLYGDEYAIPLANAIQRGLKGHEGGPTRYEIEVPIIRKSSMSSW